METTTLAQIIGPVLAAAGMGFLLHPKFYKNAINDFKKNEGLTFFTGMIIMILGLLVVLNHNIWEFSAAGLITLFGWGALLKGTLFLVMPNLIFKVSKSVLSCEMMMKIAMVVWLVTGSYLIYLGYFA